MDPPPRPGATLWSIAAGPLVNVALAPLLFGLGYSGKSMGWWVAFPNAHALLRAIYVINAGLLIFNLLPIYPLDGGQIFRSMLWFVHRSCPQLNGRYSTRAGWGSWIRNPGLLSTVRLVGNYCRLRAGQLLGRPAASACVTEDGETAASARVSPVRDVNKRRRSGSSGDAVNVGRRSIRFQPTQRVLTARPSFQRPGAWIVADFTRSLSGPRRAMRSRANQSGLIAPKRSGIPVSAHNGKILSDLLRLRLCNPPRSSRDWGLLDKQSAQYLRWLQCSGLVPREAG